MSRLATCSILVWGYLEIYMERNFFRGSALATWLGFTATFAARPLGGMFLGVLSDFFGRKLAVVITGTGMLVATVGQGLLPTPRDWGEDSVTGQGGNNWKHVETKHIILSYVFLWFLMYCIGVSEPSIVSAVSAVSFCHCQQYCPEVNLVCISCSPCGCYKACSQNHSRNQAVFLHDIKSDASEPQKGSAQHVMHWIYELYVCKDFVHELFETCNMKPCSLLCKAFVLVARSVQFQPTSQRWQLPDLWEDVWLWSPSPATWVFSWLGWRFGHLSGSSMKMRCCIGDGDGLSCWPSSLVWSAPPGEHFASRNPRPLRQNSTACWRRATVMRSSWWQRRAAKRGNPPGNIWKTLLGAMSWKLW